MVKDIFSGVGDPPTPLSSQAQRTRLNIEQMVAEKAHENGFTPSTNWVKKVMQLYTVSQVNHGEYHTHWRSKGKCNHLIHETAIVLPFSKRCELSIEIYSPSHTPVRLTFICRVLTTGVNVNNPGIIWYIVYF